MRPPHSTPDLCAVVAMCVAFGAGGRCTCALRRVWRCTHFSWWMTTMLHVGRDPFDAQLQLAQLRRVVASPAATTELAENYAGLPIGY